MSTLPHVAETGVELTPDPARVDLDLLQRELAATYWATGVPRDVVAASVAGSDVVSAHGDGGMVGFARMVTDRATFGWIADVIVVEAARGRGVGTALVADLVDRARAYGLRRVMLATKDAHGVYAPFGFAEPPPGRMMELTRDPRELYS